MASTACTELQHAHSDNGSYWAKYGSDLHGGYAGYYKNTAQGRSYHYTTIKFKTPNFSGSSLSLTVTIPFIRSDSPSKMNSTGTFYLKITSDDPRSTKSNYPSSTNKDTSVAWAAKNSSGTADHEVHTCSVTFNKTGLSKNSYYYLTIYSSEFIEVGHSGHDSKWNISLTNYTKVTANTPTITDNKNNTFTIRADAGTAGTNNAVKSTTLYYKIGDSDSFHDHSSLTKDDSLTCAASATSQNIYAYTKVVGQYNEAESDKEHYATVKNYAAPTWPSGAKVKLSDSSFKNNRLTVKQDWGWEWTPANATNTNSTVKGYRVRFFVKRKDSSSFVNTKIIDYYDKKTVRSVEVSTGDWAYDRTSTSYTMPMAAADFEQDIVPGDQIKLSVQAYSTNGLNNKLISATKTSDTYTVQNAGIVNVKIGDAWKEGQVYVKISGEWKEAETVNVKISGEWKESQ